MIKNPKLGQKVFFVDDEGHIVSGKISQIYNDPVVGVDNFFYLEKKFAFPTRHRAEKYLEACREIDYLVGQRNFYEKLIKKAQNKYESFLK
ncbi:MAG: hypothetical protein FMNOHCHN_03426 [Ignavibacteriaceae bacterium]|nr:hypothetical protein [Ignavibacteriaceae bacterium]